ncbi:NADAR family protein [Terrimonas sp. NA20]|uniref:NADAR family protein n=1 Tax=Terrimonas ginsenosidimutans TaxID=2908004 RepID=A0ABS9KTX0_9BACT|nr:NADAR family protein [Terrimonas ginsenosidimutans]MCG2615768.1 NADAR family protein [Terrimonas ginsenosidimutans]
MKYHNEWLIKKAESSEQIRFLFFWGHQPSKNGEITKTCFSQWWESSFTVDGITYHTAEHWMMAGKARMFNDEQTLTKIISAGSAPEAKKLGREVSGFDPQKWDEEKYPLVVKGNLAKFSSNPLLENFLVGTGDIVIAEASPVDSIWGIGLAADHPDVLKPSKWKGENLLGYALMEVRDLLMQNK